MAKFKKHKIRAKKIEKFIKENMLFCTIALVIIAFLFGTRVKSTPDTKKTSDSQIEVVNTSSEKKDKSLKWRIYPVDFIILFGAGGFCTAMIVRERRKQKEKLK